MACSGVACADEGPPSDYALIGTFGTQRQCFETIRELAGALSESVATVYRNDESARLAPIGLRSRQRAPFLPLMRQCGVESVSRDGRNVTIVTYSSLGYGKGFYYAEKPTNRLVPDTDDIVRHSERYREPTQTFFTTHHRIVVRLPDP